MAMIMEGYISNRIEKFGDKDYSHIGFNDDENSFGDKLVSIVPEVGMKVRVRMTIEVIENENQATHK